jgi:hypothetical protein
LLFALFEDIDVLFCRGVARHYVIDSPAHLFRRMVEAAVVMRLPKVSVSRVVNYMKEFAFCKHMQVVACSRLRSEVLEEPKRVAVGQAGGCEAILDAMRNFEVREELCVVCWCNTRCSPCPAVSYRGPVKCVSSACRSLPSYGKGRRLPLPLP